MMKRALFLRAPRRAFVILSIHNIRPTFSRPQMEPAFPQRFRRLCRMLRTRYEVVTVTEGYRRLVADEPRDKPLLAFVFDDGFADFAETIVPIMKEEGVVGTSYVVVESLRTGRLPWFEELGRLVYATRKPRLVLELGGEEAVFDVPAIRADRKWMLADVSRRVKATFDLGVTERIRAAVREHDLEPHDPAKEPMMMLADQARAAVASGFEIGCHSMTHPILSELDGAELDHEIIGARAALSELLGTEATSFCYPNGDKNERCIERAQSAGYECAVSMRLGANLPGHTLSHQLKRAALSEDIRPFWPWHALYRAKSALVSESPNSA